MNCSTPGLPVHHQLTESTQTHVHQVGDAIQPSHPLSSPSPPAPNPSQHQGLFKWVSSLHQVAKGLEFQLQNQSFQWTPRTDLLQDGPVGSPCSPRNSQESSPTPQYKSINSSALSFLHSPTLTPIAFRRSFWHLYREQIEEGMSSHGDVLVAWKRLTTVEKGKNLINFGVSFGTGAESSCWGIVCMKRKGSEEGLLEFWIAEWMVVAFIEMGRVIRSWCGRKNQLSPSPKLGFSWGRWWGLEG